MNDKIKDISTVVVFMLIIIGLFIVNILKPPTKISVSERRMLAQFPKITWESITRKKTKPTDKDTFMESFDKYTLDQFVGRDKLRELKANISFNLLMQKDNNKIYMVDGQVAKYWNDLNEGALKSAAIKFNKIYNEHLQNMNVYYSIIPDKNYYIAKQNGYPSADYNKFVGTIKSSTNKNMKYIDLFGVLNVDDYYATDLHWRQEKIIKVAEKYAKEMGFTISGEYTENVKEPFYGTYYGQSALPIPGEKLIYLTNDVLNNAKVSQIDVKTFGLVDGELYKEEYFGNVDPYDLFLEGTQKPLFIIENESATTDKELIVYRDSFGSSLVPLLVEGYKKITVVDVRYMTTTLLDSNNLIDYKDGQDVLFLYSTEVLNNSSTLLVM